MEGDRFVDQVEPRKYDLSTGQIPRFKYFAPDEFTCSMAERVINTGEAVPSFDAVNERLRDVYREASEYVREDRDTLREYIFSTTDWELEVRPKYDGRVKLRARTVFFGPDGEGYLVELNDQRAHEEPVLLAGDKTENVQEKVARILERVNYALVITKTADKVRRDRGVATEGVSDIDILMGSFRRRPEVVEESSMTQPRERDYFGEFGKGDITYTNISLRPQDTDGMDERLAAEVPQTLRGLASSRAEIIAEDETSWSEYHELVDRLKYDTALSDKEREAMLARAIDINAQNGLLDREVGGWRDRFIYDRHFTIERDYAQDETWDEDSVRAVEKELLDPKNYLFLTNYVGIQRGAAAAIKAAQLTAGPNTKNT